MPNRNLLLQYLELISEQQRIIHSLGTNLTLINNRCSNIVLQYICGLDATNHSESRSRIPQLSPRRRRRSVARLSRNQRRNTIRFSPLAPNIRATPAGVTLPTVTENISPPSRRLPRRPPQTSPPPPPPEGISRSTRTSPPTRENRDRRPHGYDRGGMYTGDNGISAQLTTGRSSPSPPFSPPPEGATRPFLLPPLIPRVFPPPSATLGSPSASGQRPDGELESTSPRSADTITTVSRSTSTDQNNIVHLFPHNAPLPRPRLQRQQATRFTNLTHIEQVPTMEELSSPVRIRPSRRQIAAATELILYCDLSDNYHTICPIDQQDFEPRDYVLRIRHCGHIFREMNLRRYFRNSPRCPICRFDIRNYDSSAEDEITNQIVSSINQIFNSTAVSVANRHPPSATAEITFTTTLGDLSDNNTPPRYV